LEQADAARREREVAVAVAVISLKHPGAAEQRDGRRAVPLAAILGDAAQSAYSAPDSPVEQAARDELEQQGAAQALRGQR
jgi:hypothetical protein